MQTQKGMTLVLVGLKLLKVSGLGQRPRLQRSVGKLQAPPIRMCHSYTDVHRPGAHPLGHSEENSCQKLHQPNHQGKGMSSLLGPANQPHPELQSAGQHAQTKGWNRRRQ